MTAVEIISEIQAMPSDEKARVVEFVHRIEDGEIPESFLTALAELESGKMSDLTDEQFEIRQAQ